MRKKKKKRPLEASEEISLKEHMFEANNTRALSGWCLDGAVVWVQTLVSMHSALYLLCMAFAN